MKRYKISVGAIFPKEPIRKNCTYTDFIPFHKWFSRIITVIGLLHGIFFIIKWAMDDNVSLKQKLILKTFNFVGFIISILVLFLLICSIGPMRRYNYRLFYIVHNLVNVAFILLTPIHSRPGVKFPFLLLNCTLLFKRLWVSEHESFHIG